jgi:hypothetical protein
MSIQDSVAQFGSNIDDIDDESLDNDASRDKRQKIPADDTRQNAGTDPLAEAPVEGGGMRQTAVQERQIDEASTHPDELVNGQRDSALV